MSVAITPGDHGAPSMRTCAGRRLSAAMIRTTMGIIAPGPDAQDIMMIAVSAVLLFLMGKCSPLLTGTGTRRSRYSSASDSSPSPHRHRRRKSFGETALGALGLGTASSKHSDHRRGRSHSRRPRSDYSSSRSHSRGRGDRSRRHRERSEQRIAQAARAALTAGAIEAFRSRKAPGPWTGEKGKRILTAAVTAAGTDGLVDKDPKKHGTRHVVESTLAGLAANHFVHGGRSQSRGRHGRSRSSSGIKNIAATGALAAAGKEIYDRFSRSRSRHRGRSSSSGSDDDRHGSKRRSKSVSEYISKGMAALGLDEERSERGRDRGSRDRVDYDDRDREHRDHREHRRRYDDFSDSDADSDYHGRSHRRGRGSRDVGSLYRPSNGTNTTPQTQAPTSAPRTRAGVRAQSADDGCDCFEKSDSDLGDSSDEQKKRKKMQRDVLLTSGLASIATIHAAHSLYGSVQKRKKRMKQLENGEITPEEARKARIKGNALDAASVGLAALGVKGAYEEWKEVHEKRKESQHFLHECTKRRLKREMRRSRSQGDSSSRNHRWPDEVEHNDSDGPGYEGVFYHDGNPYGATTEAPQISY